MSVICNHNSGFFSCCSVKLKKICDYINKNKKMPDIVDSSNQFKLYKKNLKIDITFDFFENYTNLKNPEIFFPINYHFNQQFIDYSKLDYKHLTPLVKKYFSPSSKIKDIINSIEQKYNLDYSKIISVYYRGCDKYKETKLSDFDNFYSQINNLININYKIIIQTDQAQFLDYINNKNIRDLIIISENKTSYNSIGIHHEHTSKENYNQMLYFFSTIIILSKCKYIICGSGNVSKWIMLYRGNNINVSQYLNGKWYNNIKSI